MTSSTGARWPALMVSVVCGYVIGLFPSADLAARLAGHDGQVRSEGSRNPGATNAAKVLGHAWGAAVLVGDVCKGAAGARLGRALAGEAGAAAGGVGAVLGHCFPPGRPGGKGVASRYGALAVTARGIGAIDLATAALATKATRKPGAAMALATAMSACCGLVPVGRRSPDRGHAGLVAAVTSGLIVLVRFNQERTGSADESTNGEGAPAVPRGPAPRPTIS